jgi:hypothetical protein
VPIDISVNLQKSWGDHVTRVPQPNTEVGQ